MVRKHVAQSGAKTGQWVNCTAKGECRLGGEHITERTFYAVQAWLAETGNKKFAKDVTKEDLKAFQEANPDQSAWFVKAEKLARHQKGLQNSTYPIFAGEVNLITPKVKPKAKFPVSPISTPKTSSFEFKSTFKVDAKEWQRLEKKMEEQNIRWSSANHLIRTFENGRVLHEFDNFKFNGPEEKTVAISKELNNAFFVKRSTTSGSVSIDTWNALLLEAKRDGVTVTHSDGEFFGGGLFRRPTQIHFSGGIHLRGPKEKVDPLLDWFLQASKF